MLGTRDVVWSIAICAALLVYTQWRPSFSARTFLEHESQEAFERVYAGYRKVDGNIIGDGKGGAHVDPMAPAVLSRRLEIQASQLNWTGSSGEFVVHHAIHLANGDASQDIHVRLEKRGSRWVYTHFQVRGRDALAEPDRENPFVRALHPERDRS
jgi:hypothetical protein